MGHITWRDNRLPQFSKYQGHTGKYSRGVFGSGAFPVSIGRKCIFILAFLLVVCMPVISSASGKCVVPIEARCDWSEGNIAVSCYYVLPFILAAEPGSICWETRSGGISGTCLNGGGQLVSIADTWYNETAPTCPPPTVQDGFTYCAAQLDRYTEVYTYGQSCKEWHKGLNVFRVPACDIYSQPCCSFGAGGGGAGSSANMSTGKPSS